MDLEKLKPWNWFKHEEGDRSASQVPVKRDSAGRLPPGRGDSLMSLHRDMDRWFEDAFRAFGMPGLESRLPVETKLSGMFRPQLDISGDEDCYEISLDVPGMSESDLSLEIRDDVLVIKGQKEERSEDRDKQYYRVERSYGSFQRTLALPDDAEADEIKASLEKGVLKLVVPRRAAASKDVKRISISS